MLDGWRCETVCLFGLGSVEGIGIGAAPTVVSGSSGAATARCASRPSCPAGGRAMGGEETAAEISVDSSAGLSVSDDMFRWCQLIPAEILRAVMIDPLRFLDRCQT